MEGKGPGWRSPSDISIGEREVIKVSADRKEYAAPIRHSATVTAEQQNGKVMSLEELRAKYPDIVEHPEQLDEPLRSLAAFVLEQTGGLTEEIDGDGDEDDEYEAEATEE